MKAKLLPDAGKIAIAGAYPGRAIVLVADPGTASSDYFIAMTY